MAGRVLVPAPGCGADIQRRTVLFFLTLGACYRV